jgi:hypothetical protein
MVVASHREGAAEREGAGPSLPPSANASAVAGRVHGTSLTELQWVALWEAPSLPPQPANVDSHLAERLGTDQKLTYLMLWAGSRAGAEGRRGVGSKSSSRCEGNDSAGV